MAKKLIKRLLPNPEVIKRNKTLKLLGSRFLDHDLWTLNRRSAAAAFFVGVFFAFIPIPFQMVMAACSAIIIRCNLPLAVSLVWITNPITMPVLYYFTYRVGCFLLNTPVTNHQFSISLEWFSNELARIWQPLYLGSFVTGLAFASISYIAIRLLWRWQITKAWQRRKRLIRQLRPPHKSTLKTKAEARKNQSS